MDRKSVKNVKKTQNIVDKHRKSSEKLSETVIDIRQRGKTQMGTATAIKIKPIAATPTLKGQDAENVFLAAIREPSEASIKRNEFASEILKRITR